MAVPLIREKPPHQQEAMAVGCQAIMAKDTQSPAPKYGELVAARLLLGEHMLDLDTVEGLQKGVEMIITMVAVEPDFMEADVGDNLKEEAADPAI